MAGAAKAPVSAAVTTVSAAQIRAVALDIDGTLARADHRVSPFAIEAMRTLEASGRAVIVLTGRTEASALALARAARLTTPVISCNGSLITSTTGERLLVERIEPETLHGVIAAARPWELQPVVWTPDAMRAERRTAEIDLLARINDEEVVIAPFDAATYSAAIKVMVTGPAARLDAAQPELVAAFPTLGRALPQFLEAGAAGSDKWDALDWLLTRLGVAPSATLGAGDSPTDARFLRHVAVRVAVAGAIPEIRDIATHRIGPHEDDALATFLVEYFGLDLPPDRPSPPSPPNPPR